VVRGPTGIAAPSLAHNHRTSGHCRRVPRRGILNLGQVEVTVTTVSRPVTLVSSPIWGPRPDLCYCQTDTGVDVGPALPEERTGHSQYYKSSSFAILQAGIPPLQSSRLRFLVDTYKV
jgi:hypothetical protein